MTMVTVAQCDQLLASLSPISSALFEHDEVPVEVLERLRGMVGKLAHVLLAAVPDVQTKLHEYAFAEGQTSFKVNEHLRGYDLSCGAHLVELKSSIPDAKSKLNWCFKVPEPTCGDERSAAERMAASWEEQAKSGVRIILEYKLRTGKARQRFFLSPAFLAEYVRKYPTPIGPSINLGAKVCTSCRDVHRVRVMERYSSLYCQRELEEKEWKSICCKVASQCKAPVTLYPPREVTLPDAILRPCMPVTESANEAAGQSKVES